MNERKQRAIDKAYGNAWKQVKDHVDNNGWCGPEHDRFVLSHIELDIETGRWRPFTLSELESNNGWISVEERLPHFCKTHSHWRQSEVIKPPIY